MKSLVPALRFPEFLDVGEWDDTTLGKVATFYKGKGISKSEISPNGLQPCIRYGELYTHYKETIKSIISYTNIPSHELVLSQANDVIIPASGETQIDIATASCVLESGIALGGDLNIIRSKINGVFLSYYLNNAKKKSIAELAQGISVVHLYANQLKTLSINIPEILEQQKIADCLSSVDELITAQTKKIETLKIHKKGLMQQLFPAEDEAVPSLRFPEFLDGGKWVKKHLGKVFSERQETGLLGLPLLSLTDKDGIIPQEETNRKNNSSADKSKYLRVFPEDVAYNTMRMWEGRSAYVNIEGLVSPAYTVCKPTKDTNGLFFSYYFKNHQLIHQFHKYSQGLVKDTLNLKYGVFSKIEVLVPLPDEQKKIADCLSSIDDLIVTQLRKLETLKTHKKGLMQQLFPSLIEE